MAWRLGVLAVEITCSSLKDRGYPRAPRKDLEGRTWAAYINAPVKEAGTIDFRVLRIDLT